MVAVSLYAWWEVIAMISRCLRTSTTLEKRFSVKAIR